MISQRYKLQVVATVLGSALGSTLIIAGCGGGSGGGVASSLASRLSQVTTRSTQNVVKIYTDSTYRHVQGNGIPDHAIGTFPNPDCPNTMTAQNYNFKMPVKPKAAVSETAIGMYPFGIALNGVPFDPSAALWWNNDTSSIWQYEPLSSNVKLGLDQNDGHVQPGGAYHYHGLTTTLLTNLHANGKMTLVGWAADGFPIYGPYCYSKATDKTSAVKAMRSSYRLKSGTRPAGTGSPGGTYDGTFTADYQYVAGSGDLDDCNGRTGVTAEFPTGTYYYVLTSDWPIIPRKFKGTPDTTFSQRTGSGGPGGGGPSGTPGPGATPGGTPGPGGPGGTPRPTPDGTPHPTPAGTPHPTPNGTPHPTPDGTPHPTPPSGTPRPTPNGTPPPPRPTPDSTPSGTPRPTPPPPGGTPRPTPSAPPGGGPGGGGPTGTPGPRPTPSGTPGGGPGGPGNGGPGGGGPGNGGPGGGGPGQP